MSKASLLPNPEGGASESSIHKVNDPRELVANHANGANGRTVANGNGMHGSEETIVASLIQRAHEAPGKPLFYWLDGKGRETESYTRSKLLARSKAIAGKLRGRWQVQPGERALLVYEPGLEFVVTFFACLLGCVVAVPVYPPSPDRLSRDVPRLRKVVEDCAPVIALTSRMYYWASGIAAIGSQAVWPSLAWRITTSVQDDGKGWAEMPQRESLAFLQYTSGSTGDPKGIMVSHRNIDANQKSYPVVSTGEETVVSWCPQYHDLGLIICLLGVVHWGVKGYYFSPVDFIKNPTMWPELMSKHRAVFSAAPNFAYSLVTRRATDEQIASWDLSSLVYLLDGAEPIVPQVSEAFFQRFEPTGLQRQAYKPGYGLAEITIAATWSAGGLVVSRGRVGLGPPLSDVDLRIVDPETLTELPDGEEGEVWLWSPSVASGYWGRPERSAEVFQARITGDLKNASSYLRTGDLGFLESGQLFMTGRIKDLIIVAGRNYLPQDIEQTIASAGSPFLRPGCAIAASVGDPLEKVVVVAELRDEKSRPAKFAETLRDAVTSEHGLELYGLSLLAPRTMPKTTSGKLQRRKVANLWEAEALREEEERHVWGADAGDAAFSSSDSVELRARAVLTEFHVNAARLSDIGSLTAVRCATRLSEVLGTEIPVQLILDSGTLGELLSTIEARAGGTTGPPRIHVMSVVCMVVVTTFWLSVTMALMLAPELRFEANTPGDVWWRSRGWLWPNRNYDPGLVQWIDIKKQVPVLIAFYSIFILGGFVLHRTAHVFKGRADMLWRAGAGMLLLLMSCGPIITGAALAFIVANYFVALVAHGRPGRVWLFGLPMFLLAELSICWTSHVGSFVIRFLFLRLISFSCDSSSDVAIPDILSYLSYALYPPLLLGPTLLYSSYAEQAGTLGVQKRYSGKRILEAAKYIFNLCMVVLAFEAGLHFLYYTHPAWSSAVVEELWMRLPPWLNFCAWVWLLVQEWLVLFCTSRFFRAVALLDGFEVVEDYPSCPLLLASVHDIWRNWRVSFYKWCVQYIYDPLCGTGMPQPVAIILVFCFSALWHSYGLLDPTLGTKLLPWAIGNALCLCVHQAAAQRLHSGVSRAALQSLTMLVFLFVNTIFVIGSILGTLQVFYGCFFRNCQAWVLLACCLVLQCCTYGLATHQPLSVTKSDSEGSLISSTVARGLSIAMNVILYVIGAVSYYFGIRDGYAVWPNEFTLSHANSQGLPRAFSELLGPVLSAMWIILAWHRFEIGPRRPLHVLRLLVVSTGSVGWLVQMEVSRIFNRPVHLAGTIVCGTAFVVTVGLDELFDSAKPGNCVLNFKFILVLALLAGGVQLVHLYEHDWRLFACAAPLLELAFLAIGFAWFAVAGVGDARCPRASEQRYKPIHSFPSPNMISV